MSYSKFIPQKQISKSVYKIDGKGKVHKEKDSPFSITLELLKMKLKKQCNRDGERFTCFWDYPKNKFTLTNYFTEGEPVKIDDEITDKAGQMSKLLLADIKGKLKGCKTIVHMLLECNYKSLAITKQEVYYFDINGKKNVWKG